MITVKLNTTNLNKTQAQDRWAKKKIKIDNERNLKAYRNVWKTEYTHSMQRGLTLHQWGCDLRVSGGPWVWPDLGHFLWAGDWLQPSQHKPHRDRLNVFSQKYSLFRLPRPSTPTKRKASNKKQFEIQLWGELQSCTKWHVWKSLSERKRLIKMILTSEWKLRN